MKLYPLVQTSRLAGNIAKISKKLKMKVIVTEEPTPLDSIVIISNGTPDDIVFSIASHHSNGNKVVGIVKPERERLGAVDLLQRYLTPRIKKIMILMDQEDQDIDDIFNEVQRRLPNMGIVIRNVKEENRLKVYECRFGGREFRLILIINGLDEVPTKMHTIEDHLIKAAKVFKFKVDEFENSKDAWNTLGENHQLEILKKLKEDVRDIIPQQIKGCDYLKV